MISVAVVTFYVLLLFAISVDIRECGGNMTPFLKRVAFTEYIDMTVFIM